MATTITQNAALNITGTGGAGYVNLASQSSAPSVPAYGLTQFADATSRPAWIKSDGFTRTIDDSGLTVSRTYTLPDASGTIILNTASQALTNKTITDAANTVAATQFKTTGADVVVSGAAPPTAGQQLTATSATLASWSLPILYTTSITLASADIINMAAAPVFVLAGQGANTMIQVSSWQMSVTAGNTAFTDGTSIMLTYSASTSPRTGASAVVSQTVLTSSNNSVIWQTGGQNLASDTTSLVNNVDIYITTSSNIPFASGNGSAIVTVWYTVVACPP